MKLITAMVWPDKLNDVQDAVRKLDACVTCANETLDLTNPVTSVYRGTKYQAYHHSVRIEIVVANDLMVEDVIDAIARSAAIDKCDRPGSGSIFVTTLDQYVRIPAGGMQPVPELQAASGSSRRAS